MVSLPWSGSAPLTEGYGAVPLDDVSAIDQEAQEKTEELEQTLEILRADVHKCQEREDEVERQLNKLNDYWGGKATELERELQEASLKRSEKENELSVLERPPEDAVVDPPGPKCLRWVRNTRFTSLCSVVVVVNLVTMFMEMLHPHYKKEFFLLDQAVLVFYVTELVLKAVLYQRELLFGTCSVVWWNWLDFIIVLVGILDQWLQPLFMVHTGGHGHHGQSTAVQVVKMLRLARLARILKTVRAFMQSDLSWTEGKEFQLFIMGTIAANSLIMSFESDFPDFWGWFYVEQVLLIIFSFELLVRLRFSGCMFFCHASDFAWNWLDFIIVMGGIVDEWLMPCIQLVQALMGMKSGQMFDVGEIMSTLRMARLLRVLRLVRLIKNIPPLFTLIVGIIQAMQGMAWVLVLTCVFLYAFALLSVRLVGHGMLFGGEAPAEVAAIFPSVPQSMFVLFKVMNGDTEPIEPLFHALPLSKLVFVLYMVVSSWAILSILTAVVSDNMINATEGHRMEVEGDAEAIEEQFVAQRLNDLFSQADKDDSGDLGEAEFKEMLEDHDTLNMLTTDTKLQKIDLEKVFDLLKEDDKVKREDFLDALRTEKQSVTERSVLDLKNRLAKLQRSIDAKHIGGSTPAAATGVESMLQSLLTKFDEKLEKERQAIELLVSNLGNGFDRRPGESSIETSLAKIEEHMDISKELLDRSRAECTIVSCLSKIEKQNLDIKKELFERGRAEVMIKSSLAKIEERLGFGKEFTWFELGGELSSLESVLHRVEKRLGSLTGEHLANIQQNANHAGLLGKIGAAHVHDQGQTLPSVPLHEALHGLGHDARADLKAHEIATGTSGVGLWAARDSN